MTEPARTNPGLCIFTRIPRPDPKALAALARAGIGNVSDAMHGRGVMDHVIHQVYTPMPRIFGPAITVDVSPGDGLLVRAALDLAEPGDVIVVNAHGATMRAILGGSVAMHMVHRGVQGLVVDGAVRDVAEFQSLGFPVMARAITPRSGTTQGGWGEVNVPIACGGVVVEPGDIIIGDIEGLIAVPRRWTDAVLANLGDTGHAMFEPETIRDRLAELTPDSKPPGREALSKAIATHGGTVIEGTYADRG